VPALPLLQFLPKDWIMEKWEEGYYITAMAGEQRVGGGGCCWVEQARACLPQGCCSG
jgi:hypothetical protein